MRLLGVHCQETVCLLQTLEKTPESTDVAPVLLAWEELACVLSPDSTSHGAGAGLGRCGGWSAAAACC